MLRNVTVRYRPACRRDRRAPPGSRLALGCEKRDDRALPRLAADQRAPAFDRHVELAAHAEAPRQIDPGLDREAGACDEAAIVKRLERVEVGARAVDFAAD